MESSPLATIMEARREGQGEEASFAEG